MSGRVIQGFFVGGSMRGPSATLHSAVRPAQRSNRDMGTPGAPPAAFARRASAQPRMTRGGATPASVAQPLGGDRNLMLDAAQVGLSRGGGQPLPKALLAKMEAAFAQNFSAVRVHVGPQASRIGALAFATGNDLYFAPGQFQPDSARGQQLIGHELAHVVQQRQGRVRPQGAGITIVQDQMLEAEADRLGMRAASFALQPGLPARSGGSLAAGHGPMPVQLSRAKVTKRSAASNTVADAVTEASVLSTAAAGTTGVLTAKCGKGKYTPSSNGKVHAEDYLLMALEKDHAARYCVNGLTKAGIGIEMTAWPCDVCKRKLKKFAVDYNLQLQLTITEDIGGYSVSNGHALGSIGSLTLN